ncbi:hypothetical protein HOLleu_01132 [Holothuria leucospilota]|uniref:Immunoglobulin domain-containing protein n=1 Tax=Holothuria leucospilota TaxID=206669 RepID=A0A9Q1CQ17_HOLLE|nr:hypothetical protein HOLleu_01132 [Holothuria leucospilota]
MFELTTMDLTRLFFSVCGFLWSTLWFAGVSFSSVCQSPQYIEIKSTGKVDCLFPESLYNLFWYDSTDVFHEEAVVTLLDSVKGGQGFLSGEFDIDSNGALIITNVTLEHEGTYTAIVLETPSSALIRYTVNVSVVAPAFIPLPRISGCNNASEICFQILDQHSEISCIIQDARPAVPLMWIVRSNSEDLNISSYLSISNKSLSFFTSLVTTTNPFVYTSRLTLLVCKATSPPGLLETYESFVLIQNSEIAFPVSAVKKNVEINDKLELNCTVNQMGYLVWQRKHYAERAFFNVVVAVLSGGNFQTQIGEDDYTVKASGMLVVNDVNTQHEGVYRCINGNGLEDGVVIYEVVVFGHFLFPLTW